MFAAGFLAGLLAFLLLLLGWAGTEDGYGTPGAKPPRLDAHARIDILSARVKEVERIALAATAQASAANLTAAAALARANESAEKLEAATEELRRHAFDLLSAEGL